MEPTSENATLPDQRLVLITRVFDAPPQRVFKAWAEPEALLRWYAPTGCSLHSVTMHFRQGGAFHHAIRTPDGQDCWCKGVYREIKAPERIVYTMVVTDAQGNDIEPVALGMDPQWPRETTVTVTFHEHEGKTKFSLHQTVLESTAKRTGAHPSWLDMLDRLARELAP